MARSALLLTLLICLISASAAQAAVRATQLETFSQPVYLTAPPEDPRRLYVVEKEGTVRVLRDGVKLAEPFLDISGDVVSGGEQGLLSLAFAPDFASSGRFYVYYTTPAPGGNDVIVDEFTARDPDRADTSTRRRILTIPHRQATNHDGGQLMFGPDGYLWITTGDGGGGNDQFGNAQDLGSLLGKVLRIDPRGGSPYAIPPGNPFAGDDGRRDEIWAYGLRNPFRASFDRQTGDLTIGDVGQSRAEEINFSPRGTDAGRHYGWSCFEGFQPNARANGPCDANPIEPVLEQTQSNGWRSIIGGRVVRDPALGDLNGRYLYGDFYQSELRSAVLARPRVSDDRPTGIRIENLTSISEDGCGHVYATSISGPVYRLDGDQPPTPCGDDAADSTAPTVAISRARRQKALRRKGFVIAVRCSELCGYSATGRLRISGRKRPFVLKTVSRLVVPGQKSKIKLRMSRTARKHLHRALARRKRSVASFVVTARDAAGNEGRRRASSRARR